MAVIPRRCLFLASTSGKVRYGDFYSDFARSSCVTAGDAFQGTWHALDATVRFGPR